MNLYISDFKTPYGNIYAGSTIKGLSALCLCSKTFEYWLNSNNADLTRIKDGIANKHVFIQLEQYFKGERKQFELELNIIKATEFQNKVWEELLNIAYGATITYKQLACLIKNNKYSRAVAQANHNNPIAIVIPCHRVICSDGSLGGYASGVKIKQQLLNLEKNYFKNDTLF